MHLGESGDARLIGVTADKAFRHSASHPDGAFLAALADNLKDPSLVRVAERKALASVGIAEGVDELRHHLDSLAAVPGTLEGQIDEVAVVDAHVVALRKRLDTTPCSLADCKLMLVDETHHAVGVRHLRYLDLELAAAVVVELDGLAERVVTSFVVAKLPVARVAVGGVCNHCAAVGTSPTAADKVGASGGN